MNTKELKPCPFCGGEARYIYYQPHNYVQCKKCNAASGVLVDIYEKQDRKKEVKQDWNRRAENG